ncbi:MAG: membrane protein insertion efficiency factor YidD [Methylococcales bacterium]|nr:membrane protein insertion efficiency factor YidD [Methylococcales bacterium]
MKSLVVFLIQIYQRYLSPYKGFRCAHAVLEGGDSCSQAIKLKVLNQGCLKGFYFSRLQFERCRKANKTLIKRRRIDQCDCLSDGACQCMENCFSKDTLPSFDSACDVCACDCSF